VIADETASASAFYHPWHGVRSVWQFDPDHRSYFPRTGLPISRPMPTGWVHQGFRSFLPRPAPWTERESRSPNLQTSRFGRALEDDAEKGLRTSWRGCGVCNRRHFWRNTSIPAGFAASGSCLQTPRSPRTSESLSRSRSGLVGLNRVVYVAAVASGPTSVFSPGSALPNFVYRHHAPREPREVRPGVQLRPRERG
jgi:hypothetical protein